MMKLALRYDVVKFNCQTVAAWLAIILCQEPLEAFDLVAQMRFLNRATVLELLEQLGESRHINIPVFTRRFISRWAAHFVLIHEDRFTRALGREPREECQNIETETLFNSVLSRIAGTELKDIAHDPWAFLAKVQRRFSTDSTDRLAEGTRPESTTRRERRSVSPSQAGRRSSSTSSKNWSTFPSDEEFAVSGNDEVSSVRPPVLPLPRCYQSPQLLERWPKQYAETEMSCLQLLKGIKIWTNEWASERIRQREEEKAD
jgi:hypothetical protein